MVSKRADQKIEMGDHYDCPRGYHPAERATYRLPVAAGSRAPGELSHLAQ